MPEGLSIIGGAPRYGTLGLAREIGESRFDLGRLRDVDEKRARPHLPAVGRDMGEPFAVKNRPAMLVADQLPLNSAAGA
ncbi:MAG TPA: hypothetical protein DCQ98_02930 [Planctomycetaceae bacterium]|nr:hypothetical protein [Planctomycetaceae bacterium]